MKSGFLFWLWGVIILQLLTGLVHSLSFFVEQVPTNDTEKQLLDLMSNYSRDMGAGFHPSMHDFLTALSACFTAICLMAGAINWYLHKRSLQAATWKGLMLIQLIFFGGLFMLMYRFTFLPPVVFTGLITVFLAGAVITSKNKG